MKQLNNNTTNLCPRDCQQFHHQNEITIDAGTLSKHQMQEHYPNIKTIKPNNPLVLHAQKSRPRIK